ncbi:retrotransposon protein, putative, ty1-copia subclass [Tanacetum coccineum]|uniref:Retrotransposon protein, putative, ty1-copia subclass n=1 Tax=Tanacetum coccineum TaxID=301880 RepID=A0ABQ5HAN1_9ASTR
MDRAVHTYKARLVAKGYTQTPGIDYEETFSPVADIRAIRILIAIAAYYDYEIWQMDVKTAFLNGYLNEEVYMEQPEGFVNPKYPNRVCKLKRSIYGLKQASRQWNKRFDDEIKKFGFSQNADEPCVYLKASGSNVTFLILYVDDILIMGNSIPMLQDVKSYLGKCFAMKDLGEAAYILGIKIYRDRSRRLIGLCQSAYIEKILKRFHMENSKRGSIPMQDKLRLSKSQGASTPAELKRMQSVPYASGMDISLRTKNKAKTEISGSTRQFQTLHSTPKSHHHYPTPTWAVDSLAILKHFIGHQQTTRDQWLKSQAWAVLKSKGQDAFLVLLTKETQEAQLTRLELPIYKEKTESRVCMRTRSQSRNLNRQQQQTPSAFVEPFNLEEPIENPAPPMDDTRTMAQLLEAPTEGYEDAIVVPEITADNFELKHGLLSLV